ncbi:alpha/beta hydrolase [Nocardia sp. NPDC050710]|uniref:alpha/beta hydrolase n=1 Tax=Nocardia sp. NPDC050710 TaxID=3157220 RepID=UPI0033F8EB34
MIPAPRSILGTTAAAVAIMLAAAAAVVANPVTGFRPSTCHEVTATLPDSSRTIAGTLCAPQGAAAVQILLHGSTTNRSYWDFPYQWPTYSYVHAAQTAGFATLRIDLLGSGASFHPASTAVGYGDQADAVHHLVSALRDGSFDGARFDTVAIVGHSSGSLVGLLEAARYHDVDALVVTAFTPMFNVDDILTRLVPNLVPAVLDPRFSGSGLDPGYVTTRAGSRAMFYHPADTDPQVIAADETSKDTTAMPVLTTVTPATVFEAMQAVDIPVLTVNGADDPFSCGLLASDCSSSTALAASGRAVFGPTAVIEAEIVPHSGHNLALEYTAAATAQTISSFLTRRLGTGHPGTEAER